MEISARKAKEHHDKTGPNIWRNMQKYGIISLLALGAIALHWTCNNGNVVSLQNLVLLKQNESIHHVSKNGTLINQDCNMFTGRWVYDDVSYPLYKERKCPFIEYEFTCERYGRKNLKYQHWRWQPHHCDIPRFNGSALMEKLRGKKLVFVGDSMGRNQWRSMLCLIDSYLPQSSTKSLKEKGNLKYFYSKEYNVTIGFYWAPFLVESNSDHLHRHGGELRIIQIKSIEKHGKNWLDTHILVFDSFAWWMSHTNIVKPDDAIDKKVHKNKQLQSYEMGLNTWSEWLELHINRTKTKLFFMGFSPFRLGYTKWRKIARCNNQTEPIFDENHWPYAAKREMMEILETSIKKLEENGLKVGYLNITQLSGYREDAQISDCLHWCLPGVPDTWNEILYTYIIKLDTF